jgi:hypothetical protein
MNTYILLNNELLNIINILQAGEEYYGFESLFDAAEKSVVGPYEVTIGVSTIIPIRDELMANHLG